VVVDVYGDADQAYKSNTIRITSSASYVAGSLKLSLGELSVPVVTNVPVPQPIAANAWAVPASQQQGNFYLAYVDVPYNGIDFVFGAIGGSSGNQGAGNATAGTTTLVDPTTWVANANVPYHVPTVVKAEADEYRSTPQDPNGGTIHSVACAEPASCYDPRPTPGGLAIEGPDGIPPHITQPLDLLNDKQLNSNANHVVVQTSSPGDFPTDPGSQICGPPTTPSWPVPPGPWPFPGQQPVIADIWRCTLYDWIRRGGTTVQIDQVIAMQTTPFAYTASGTPTSIDWCSELVTGGGVQDITTMTGGPQIPFGMMMIYKFDTSGNVLITGIPESPFPYEVVSENQLYGEDVGDYQVNDPNFVLTFHNVVVPQLKGKKNIKCDITIDKVFDVYVRDEVRVLGKTLGGKHGGEPLDNTLTSTASVSRPSRIAMAGSKSTNVGFGGDHGGGGRGAMPGGQGTGAPPLLTTQDDFAETSVPPPPYVAYAAGPGTVRPTYQSTGLTGSIRFRRQIPVSGPLLTLYGTILLTSVGYFGDKTGVTMSPKVITYTSSDPVDVTDMNNDK
jgi:hypothetical protein